MRISDWSSDVCSSDLWKTYGASTTKRWRARLPIVRFLLSAVWGTKPISASPILWPIDERPRPLRQPSYVSVAVSIACTNLPTFVRRWPPHSRAGGGVAAWGLIGVDMGERGGGEEW